MGSPKDRVRFQRGASLDVHMEVPQVAKRVHYQAEGPQHRQAPLPDCTQLYQAHCDDDAVKDVPVLLEVIVGVERYDFEDHFSSKKHSKDLRTETDPSQQGLSGRGTMTEQGENVVFIKWQIPSPRFYSVSILSAGS